MNSTTSQVEVTLETKVTTLESDTRIDAVKELAEIELAYVGGGMATVYFG